ncbi:MAG: PRC-barrel domain-containing protein [Methanosphaera sp.]|nr:PRC-barrel domain-containing protein [Methanosphaera sp.]
MRIVDNIIGKEVVNNEATILGKAVDVEVDTTTNILESLIVTNQSESDDKHEKIRIPFEEVLRIGDKILIKDPLENGTP